jgi:rubrerythrin
MSATAAPVTELLITAAKTEVDAYQQYYAYAQAAASSGQPALATVWQTVGEVQHQDHFTHEVTLAKLYSGSDNASNLRTLADISSQIAAKYRVWAAEAPTGSAAAAVLQAVATREAASNRLLVRALNALGGHATMPAPPPVATVPIIVAPRPHYSGIFYDHLTNDADSALEAAAWIWGGYQFAAKTAVDTGQADLAALLSGLEAQAQRQTWPELLNVAGFVNGNALNLQTSIASEQSAITMYGGYATQAQQAGDTSVADVFRGIQGDETGHHRVFSTELLQYRGSPSSARQPRADGSMVHGS